MSKKLQGNGLFESSRMMLPEHREAYIQHQQHLVHRKPPLIDPQAEEEMARVMAEALYNHSPITITLFDEPEDLQLTGHVLRIDASRRQIRWGGDTGEGPEWIRLDQIIDAVAESSI
ncbi:YolD-like family protein [Paenibacillus sp. HJL G12]|uniref:YolD-like family protein n=1 Tax=Paenibacillus dendrobii TaxID=2691084 RepID=A0A7X3IKH7_9BACL|nr:YolD-like family protein [Paenibacillus dendrobii]MWV45116.1 YolD-like family protein [Paenibacillus dendrobii]